MNHHNTIAIIGSGPTALYLLKGILDHLKLFPKLGEIHIYEKDTLMGLGMPYNPRNIDEYHLANITSEEIPMLTESFAGWLSNQSNEVLANLDIDRQTISEKKVYSRIALGQYFYDQYTKLLKQLKAADKIIFQYPGIAVTDMKEESSENLVHLFLSDGSNMKFDSVYIATGHNWDDPDQPENGYFKSPWPITKILPQKGEYYNFEIGLLGSSLSAFDVVTSLAHRHGKFSSKGDELSFQKHSKACDFKVLMHSTEGWLPHLQYEQKEPVRKIYRYTDRESLMKWRDKDGFLRIETYFDKVCRRVLQEALFEDGQTSMVMNLTNTHFGFKEFIEEMSARHSYKNPFEGMRKEMKIASTSVTQNEPIYWKEALDDLMYTLNFHAEYLPAEDHIFFRKEVMPFLMNVIAAMPLQSAKIMLALYDAGALDMISGEIEEIKPGHGKVHVTIDQDDSKSATEYRLFVECGGDKKVTLENFPFRSLISDQIVRPARIAFAKRGAAFDLSLEDSKLVFTERGIAYYTLAGIDVTKAYRIIGSDGVTNSKIIDLSFLHTAGLRPYSYGLQACQATSELALRLPCDRKDSHLILTQES